MVKNRLSKCLLPITRQECDELHHNYSDFLITGISLNDTKMVEITEIGSIDFESNCNGSSFSNEQGTCQNSIMITALTITLEDCEDIQGLQKNGRETKPL